MGTVIASNYVTDYFKKELTIDSGYAVIFFYDWFHIEIIHPVETDGNIFLLPTPILREYSITL